MPDAADLDFLGLEPTGDDRWTFELTPPLSRLDGMLYGGTALAAGVAVMEAVTGRDTLWATAQFVATTGAGSAIECRAEVLARGRRASQVRVTGTTEGRVLFEVSGSTAVPQPEAFGARFGHAPAVEPPEASPPFEWRLPFRLPEPATGFLLASEFRDAVGRGDDGLGADRFAVWARMRDRAMTRATLAFVADMVPMGVARGAGRAGGGRSLDNSMRFGPPPAADTDWVLVDLEPHLAHGGFGHGLARLWSPDGTLLAVATQTASMLLFD